MNEIDAKMLAWATDRFGMVSTDEHGQIDLNGMDHEQRKEYDQKHLHLCALAEVDRRRDEKRRKNEAFLAMFSRGDQS